MRLYRVTWADPHGWHRLSQGNAGHPLHVPLTLQGGGRFDNPAEYAALYAAMDPDGAVGETFGTRHTWTHAMFERPKDDLRRTLVTIEIDRTFVDLDNTETLSQLGLRPSDVVRRNQEKTREIAMRLWSEEHRRIGGVTWWSYHRPEWQLAMVWSRSLESSSWFEDLEVVDVEALDLDHTAIRRTAAALPRRIEA